MEIVLKSEYFNILESMAQIKIGTDCYFKVNLIMAKTNVFRVVKCIILLSIVSTFNMI